MRTTGVVALASLVVVLALAGCVRITIAPSPAVVASSSNPGRLLLKVLSLLQDNDASLASAISTSRESIWGILVDPAEFAKLG